MSLVTPEYFRNTPQWDVVVIIPTLYRSKFLAEVLHRLGEQTVPAKEIIIIDQSEPDDVEVEMYKEFSEKLPLQVYHLRKKSKPIALNWGLVLSKSPLIISVDDDTEFDSNLIFNHLLAMHEHHVDCISGAVVHRNFLDLKINYRIPLPWENGVYTIGHNPMVNYSCMIMGIAGCNFSIRREAVLKVNGWDENMTLLDDRDLAMYLFKSGAKMHYDPRPKVIHLKTPMGGWRFQQKNKFRIGNLWAEPSTGYVYFYRKHFSAQESLSMMVLTILRGHPHFANYRFKTFLKTPFRIIGAIKAWRESSSLLRIGPVYLDAQSRGDELKVVVQSVSGTCE